MVNRFPKSEENKAKWIKALKDNFEEDKVNELLLKNKYIYICDLHFDVECFYRTGQGLKLLLQKGCIPSIFTNFRSTAPYV